MKTTGNRLKENISYLFLVQASNFILPLISLPYLTHVLGSEKFGLIVFTQAFIYYFVIITDYGFNLSATRLISVNRHNLNELSKIICATMAVKISLLVLSMTCAAIIILTIPLFRENVTLNAICFLLVIGHCFLPTWYFQGTETIKTLAIMELISRTLSLALLFLIVHQKEDYILAAAILSVSPLFSAIMAMTYIFKTQHIILHTPEKLYLANSIRDGWHIFLSTCSINLYTTSTTFFIGIFSTPTMAGYFNAAEKIVRAAHGLLTPISQASYPHTNHLLQQSKLSAITFVKKILFLMGGISFIVSILLFIFSDNIVSVLFGDEFSTSSTILQILSPLPFVIALSNIFGTQIMLSLGLKGAFFKIIGISGLLNTIMVIPLIINYEAEGAAVSILITETIVSIWMFISITKHNFNPLSHSYK